MQDPARPLYLPPTDTSGFEIEKLRKFINSSKGLNLKNYDELHAFSVQHQNDFWLLLWDFLDIKCSVRPQKALDEGAHIDQFPEFYPGSRLNYAENTLHYEGDAVALISFSERSHPGHFRHFTWDELRESVRKVAGALRHYGVSQGDVVSYLGSNTPSPVIVFLASASLGAIFCSLAGDMGEKAVLDRLWQVRPKILFADNAYQYNGKVHVCTERISRIAHELRRNAGLSYSIIVENIPMSELNSPFAHSQWINFDAFVREGDCTSLTFQQLPFNHPMLILFSSGTTGKPKGMVHSHGGPLINLKKEHAIHENMRHTDIYYHYSNIGWTMWNIFLGGMLTGATLVLYDGSPFYPSPAEQLHFVISLGTTVFGGSPRYYAELKDRGVSPQKLRAKSKIRLLGSTGAVLPATTWTWMSEEFDFSPITSFSGGTEACGSFVQGSLIHHQYAGEITVKGLGIDVDIIDEDGCSCPLGTPGDLVIRKPFPNAAVKFWDDPDFKRYRASYFEQFPGVWTQGDFAKINPTTGGIIMLGRSDGILNPSGVRFGSSEIYGIVDKFVDRIQDSICVGQRNAAMDEQVMLFVQMRPGKVLDEDLEQQIRTMVAQSLSVRHVPKYILAVPKIPYNVNGKKLEVLVKKVISGDPLHAKYKSTLVSPDDLEVFKQFTRLRGDGAREKSRL